MVGSGHIIAYISTFCTRLLDETFHDHGTLPSISCCSAIFVPQYHTFQYLGISSALGMPISYDRETIVAPLPQISAPHSLHEGKSAVFHFESSDTCTLLSYNHTIELHIFEYSLHFSISTIRTSPLDAMPSQNSIPPFPDVPTAHLTTIDMDALAAGDASQAHALHSAATGYGFFYLTNHHVDSRFMFDLANSVFNLPLSEKMKHDMGTTGHYYGYKRSGSMYVDEKGTPDHSEFYNISKDEVLGVGDVTRTPHPQVVWDRREELETYMRACHRVVETLVRALGKELGLDPELLPGLHQVDRPSCCQARVTHAPPVDEDVIALGEHTDFGSVTVLFNQLGGLQVLAPGSQEWVYVKPRPECAVINLGDAFVKMVDGRLKSAVHRVVGPPGVQARSERHSAVYFSRPNSDVLLKSVFEKDPAKATTDDGEKLMNADEWVAQRAKNWNSANYKGKESFKLSRGTEHNRNTAASASLDRPPKEVEAV